MSTMDKSYAEFAVEKTCELLAIDSPSGFTDKAAQWIKNEFSELGFPAVITAKGGVLIDLFGDDDSDALLLEAHTDTLGGMVSQIKGNGRLKISALGGMNANNGETEECPAYTQGAARFTRVLCSSATQAYT